MTAVAATNTQSPFAMADKIFPDSYYGESEPADHKLSMYSDGDGPSFKDLIDIINPLQHIPVISAIYRDITGDEPGAGARLIGGALYGGPLGLIGEEINCAIDDHTGKDVGGHVLAYLKEQFGGSSDTDVPATDVAAAPAAAPQIAAAEPPPPVAAPQPAVTADKVAMAAAPVAIAPAAGAATPTPAAAIAAPGAMSADPNARFLPVPQRRSIDVVSPPLVRVPLSNNGQRSNAPMTGRPTVSPSVSPAAVQQAMAAQEAAAAQTNGNAALSGAQAASATPSADTQTWFTAAMMQGLQKYQRAASRSGADPTSASTSQQ